MHAKFVRSEPSDLVRVGAITGAGGHLFGIWGNGMNPPAGNIRSTGMLLTHVWCLKPEMRQRVAEQFSGVQVVDDPTDMLEHIEGFFLDDINAISVYPQLVRPFLQAGIPTYVNRPFATSLSKGQEMVDLAKTTGTPLLSSSTWEFTESVGDLRAKAADLPDIKGYVAHNSMSDYYTHGLHGVWYIHAVLRDEIRNGRGRMTAAAYHTPDWRKPGGQVVYEHEHPEQPYYGSLQLISGADGQAYMRISGDNKGDAEGKIPGRPGFFQYNTWNAMQLVIQEMFETGISPESGDDLMEKLAMFLLPFYSALEEGGNLARRDSLDDWELPPPCEALKRNGEPTDSAFQIMYTESELSRLAEQMA